MHSLPPQCLDVPAATKAFLPLRLTEHPTTPTVTLASTPIPAPGSPFADTCLHLPPDTPASQVTTYDITRNDIAQIYILPTPYHTAFEQALDIRKLDTDKHPTAGLSLVNLDGRLVLASINTSSPAARIPRWRTQLRGAWLIQVGDTTVHTHLDVRHALDLELSRNSKSCRLLFAHPEITHGLTNDGLPHLTHDMIPQLNIDQLSTRRAFDVTHDDNTPRQPQTHRLVEDGEVMNLTTKVMKLTRGKLMKQNDWEDWRRSEFLQLDQYEQQHMFGLPVAVTSYEAVFNLVWTYVEKISDGRKKARCTCDGSTRAGQVRVLDETYASCMDRTSSRLYWALVAAENLLSYGADVSNAFGEAAPPRQGFFIRPDKAFHDWWTIHKGRDPIPDGYVIPVLAAMQGHPESPRLWEKHIDGIIRGLGFTPTVHEPCLYSGTINGHRVLFMRQVDDFAVATPSEDIANHVFDLLDEKLSIPLKQQGLLTLFNGIDILQTRDFVKLSCTTYIDKISGPYLDTWMRTYLLKDRPTPLPSTKSFMNSLLSAVGDSETTRIKALEKQMGFSYRSGIGHPPDLCYDLLPT